MTFLLQGNNGDGQGDWVCRTGEAVFCRPQACLHAFFLEPVEAFTVHAGTLENEPRGLLRLGTELRGAAVTAVLIPYRQGADPPVAVRTPEGLRIQWRGQSWSVARQAEAVVVNGQAYAL